MLFYAEGVSLSTLTNRISPGQGVVVIAALSLVPRLHSPAFHHTVYIQCDKNSVIKSWGVESGNEAKRRLQPVFLAKTDTELAEIKFYTCNIKFYRIGVFCDDFLAKYIN